MSHTVETLRVPPFKQPCLESELKHAGLSFRIHHTEIKAKKDPFFIVSMRTPAQKAAFWKIVTDNNLLDLVDL